MNLLLHCKSSAKIGLLALLFSCQTSPNAGKETTKSNEPALSEQTSTSPAAKPATASKATTAVDCSNLLTAGMIEEYCQAKAIKERITSVERKGATCNRSYGLDKAWGDELIFIASPKSDGAASFNAMKKQNAANGLKELSEIGEAAFSLSFTDKLTGRQQEQIVFHKKNLLVELKTQESRSAKTPCPCFNASQLKSLAKAIAEKIQ